MLRETARVKFAFIRMHAADYGVSQLCQSLEVSRSGYYASLSWQPSKRQQENEGLVTLIRKVHQQSAQRYGSLRIHQALVQQGKPCSLGRVKRLMRQAGIYAKLGKRSQKVRAGRETLVMENLLKQEDIAVTTINQRYYADITLIPTKEGWLYLAAVMDAYSRRIIRRLGASLTGYAMNDNMQTDLVIQALRMATKQRRPPKGLIHHSDRGSQFTSHAFARELVSWGFRQSFTATGACLDNAYIESFFATLKKELVYQNAFATREEARNALFAYINMTYNRYRLHSSLGYQSPDAFEATSTNSPWRWRLRLYLLCPRTSTNSSLQSLQGGQIGSYRNCSLRD